MVAIKVAGTTWESNCYSWIGRLQPGFSTKWISNFVFNHASAVG